MPYSHHCCACLQKTVNCTSIFHVLFTMRCRVSHHEHDFAQCWYRWWSSDGNQPGAIQSPPMLRITAQVMLASGRVVSVVTNGEWTSHPGPVMYDSVYIGEHRCGGNRFVQHTHTHTHTHTQSERARERCVHIDCARTRACVGHK